MTRRKPLTADELNSQLERDPEYQRKKTAWKQRSEEAFEEYQRVAGELLDTLRRAGFTLQTVRDLRQSGRPYSTALPILAEWLPRIDHERVKEDIVRSLSVNGAQRYLPVVFAAFHSAGPGSLRWALGNAIEILANEEVAQDMLRIATDTRFGRDRAMVVLGLGKVSAANVTSTLLDLLNDRDMAPWAVQALAKLHAIEALPHLRKMLQPKMDRTLKGIVEAAISKIEKPPRKRR